MKGVDNALLPYKKDKGLRAIFYLALAIVILCRRSIYRRLAVRTGTTNDNDRGL